MTQIAEVLEKEVRWPEMSICRITPAEALRLSKVLPSLVDAVDAETSPAEASAVEAAVQLIPALQPFCQQPPVGMMPRGHEDPRNQASLLACYRVLIVRARLAGIKLSAVASDTTTAKV